MGYNDTSQTEIKALCGYTRLTHTSTVCRTEWEAEGMLSVHEKEEGLGRVGLGHYRSSNSYHLLSKSIHSAQSTAFGAYYHKS